MAFEELAGLDAVDEQLRRMGVNPEMLGTALRRPGQAGMAPTATLPAVSMTGAPAANPVGPAIRPAVPDRSLGTEPSAGAAGVSGAPEIGLKPNNNLPAVTMMPAAKPSASEVLRNLQGPKRDDFPAQKMPLWKKLLGAVASTAAGIKNPELAGETARVFYGAPQREADRKFKDAEAEFKQGREAIVQGTQLDEREAQTRNIESEIRARDDKPEPRLPEAEQALQDYLAANKLDDTPANRDKGRAALQERAKGAGKEDKLDKKIDEYTGANGRRVLTFQRPDGTTYSTQGGQVKDVATVPTASGSGDALLGALSPADAALVKGIANYQIDPKTLSYRGGAREKFLSLVRQYDPTYDQTQYGARASVRKDFQSGKSAQNVRSLNTAIGHLDTLSKAAEELNNSGYQTWNRITNWGLAQAGDPRTVKFNDAANAVVNEMASVFKGTGATDQEIKEWRQQVNSAQSPEQLRQGIQQLIQLMSSRMEALDNQYQTGLGKPRDFRFLSPESRQILKKLGGSAKDMLEADGRSGSAGGTAQGAAAGGAGGGSVIRYDAQGNRIP